MFGAGAMTNSIPEIRDTDLMFIIGSNTSEAHPIIAMEMKRSRQRGLGWPCRQRVDRQPGDRSSALTVPYSPFQPLRNGWPERNPWLKLAIVLFATSCASANVWMWATGSVCENTSIFGRFVAQWTVIS